MYRSGLETLLDVREWSGDPPDCPGVVGRLFQKFGRPSRMSGSCRETLPDVPEGWEALPDDRKWLGDTPGCLGVVGWPSRMSGNGQEAFLDFR